MQRELLQMDPETWKPFFFLQSLLLVYYVTEGTSFEDVKGWPHNVKSISDKPLTWQE